VCPDSLPVLRGPPPSTREQRSCCLTALCIIPRLVAAVLLKGVPRPSAHACCLSCRCQAKVQCGQGVLRVVAVTCCQALLQMLQGGRILQQGQLVLLC
jgi:hypothetical protein